MRALLALSRSVYVNASSRPNFVSFSSLKQLGVAARCYSAPSTRNIGIIAHIDAGKTTTTERMLYFAGETSRLGNVDDGDTVTDFLDAERARGITIQSAAITLHWQGTTINLIDTPGHADFTFEVIRSLRVLDGAVTILDGVAGVEAQTEKVWAQATELKIPRLVFINKMDRPGAGFGRTVKEVVSKLKTRVAVLNIPHFSGSDDEFRGVIDVLHLKLLTWDRSSDGRSVSVSDASENPDALAARAALVEVLSEVDEDVVEEFLERGDNLKVSTSTLTRAIRKATLTNEITPVLCGASFRNIGVQPLLDAVVEYLPSPEDAEISAASPNPKSTLVQALAFKVVQDPMKGPLVYVRVYAGTLKKGATIFNTTNQTKEKVSRLLRMQADESVDITEIPTGSIGVITGSKDIKTGDTLIAHPTKKDGVSILTRKEKSTKLLPIAIPSPVFIASVSPKSVSDTRSMKAALDILLREDPSLRLTYDDEVGQWLLAGMGELHLEIARDRLVKDLKANVVVGKIMITYKETLREPTRKTGIHKENDSGALDAIVTISPRTNNEGRHEREIALDDENSVVVHVRRHPILNMEEVVNNAVVGIKPVIAKGGKLGRRELRDLKFDITLNIAPETLTTELIAPAVREAAAAALQITDDQNFVLLEPVMKMLIQVPQEFLGAVTTDVSSKLRGHIQGIGEDNQAVDMKYEQIAESLVLPVDHTMHLSRHGQEPLSTSKIHAIVPLRKTVGYLPSLRSMTQGRGTFHVEFATFEPVTPQDIDEVLAS